ERPAPGRVGSPSGAEDDAYVFLAGGGVDGTLVDALSGPVGGVFARPTEGFGAHGAPWSRACEPALALEVSSRDLEPGVALVIAEVEDPDPDALDSALDALGGTPARRDAATFSPAPPGPPPRPHPPPG